jgi:hypothetical protein
VVARIAVRVQLHGEFSEGALQRAVIRFTGDAEDFVKIAFGHGMQSKQREGPPGCPGRPASDV